MTIALKVVSEIINGYLLDYTESYNELAEGFKLYELDVDKIDQIQTGKTKLKDIVKEEVENDLSEYVINRRLIKL